MRRLTRVGLITLALSLGVAAFVLTTAGLSAAAVTAEPNLAVEVRAPEHVSLDAPYVVNLAYSNLGGLNSTDNVVSAILPEGVTFVNSTTPRGDPWPPDNIAGDTLSWNDEFIMADGTWDHIYIVLQPAASLQEGDLLTVTATISTSLEESKLENNTASVTSIVSEMAGSSKQVHARTILPADVLTYTIGVNLAQQAGGGQNARWVTLTDTLPLSHQVRFLGWRGTVTGTQLDARTLQWQERVRSGEPLSLQYRLGVEGDVPPGTVLTNVARMGWAGQHMQLGPITTVVTVPHGMLGLGPYQGGEAYHRYGVSLTIPPGAVTDTTRFQIRPLLTDTPPITPPGGLLFANRAFEMNAVRFGEEVRQFNRPLTITVHYTDTDVQGLRRETLRLWTRAGPAGPWTMLGEPARVMSGALAFTTDHLSQFALFGEAAFQLYLPLVIR
jgi:hypothetical protein